MMEIQFGVKGNYYEEIFFTEETISDATPIKHLHVEISRQNSNLDEIKKCLAQEAKSLGANVVMNFCYGQKPHSAMQLVFTLKWDTESWHGEGDATKV